MSQRDFRRVLVSPSTSVRETIRVMNAGAMEIVLVVDGQGCLAGTITDGDVRRGLVRDLSLEAPVEDLMHRQPVTASPGTPREEILRTLQVRDLRHMPIVEADGTLVGLELLTDLIGRPEGRDNPVLILAGGLGTRLRPLTEDMPKPLLPVGPRSLLETLIEQVAGYGFRDFYVAVGYRAEQVERLLGDGSHLQVHIRYLREPEPLGTAGPIRLLRDALTRPFLVVNGDLLTKANFGHLLAFHAAEKHDLTIGVTAYTHRVPFGVVEVARGLVVALEEKPEQSWLISAGMYVLEPAMASMVPNQGPFDMPALIRAALAGGGRVGTFPVHEYWLDVGAPEEYRRAHAEYPQHFERRATP
jgi:dTDP-glucose pyrophosphorylase